MKNKKKIKLNSSHYDSSYDNAVKLLRAASCCYPLDLTNEI